MVILAMSGVVIGLIANINKKLRAEYDLSKLKNMEYLCVKNIIGWSCWLLVLFCIYEEQKKHGKNASAVLMPNSVAINKMVDVITWIR